MYKLQKKGWFGIWWTVIKDSDKEKMEKYAKQLNESHDSNK